MKVKSISLIILSIILMLMGCSLDDSDAGQNLVRESIGSKAGLSYFGGSGFDYCVDLGVAKAYTLFLKQNLSQFNVDSLGMIAAGGDVLLRDFGVGLNLTRNDVDSLVVGGRLDFQRGSVYHGNVVYGSAGSLDMAVLNGMARQGASIDFTASFLALESLSAQLESLPSNAAVENHWGSIVFNGTDSSLNVFNVSASTLEQAHTLDIFIPAGAKALINVSGNGHFTLQYKGLTSNMDRHSRDILFNLPGFSNITLQGIGMKGTILAPNGHIDFNNGNIDGSIIAYSLSGNGESHYFPFEAGCEVTPTPTETPTPTPTETPTPTPTETPTPTPTETPTPEPTETPTPTPTETPTPTPTETPTPTPTETPTPEPTETPVPSVTPVTCVPEVFSVTPDHGTIGSIVVITGSCFGEIQGQFKFSNRPTTVLSWTDSKITILITPELHSAIWPVNIIKPGEPWYRFNKAFEVMVPQLELTSPLTISTGEVVQLSGLYFGSNSSEFSLKLQSKTENTLVYDIATSYWYMDPISGSSVCNITVSPDVPVGEYYIYAQNLTGSSSIYDGIVVE